MSGKWDKWYYFKSAPKQPILSGPAKGNSIDEILSLTGLFFLAALGILGWQIYIYLKLGSWQPLSVITLLVWFDNEWARAPSNWVGVHKILDEIPLALASFFIGFAPMGVWLWLDERR